MNWFLVVIFITNTGMAHIHQGWEPVLVPNNTEEMCVSGAENVLRYLEARGPADETWTVNCIQGSDEDLEKWINNMLRSKPA